MNLRTIHPSHHPLHAAEHHLRRVDPRITHLIDRHGAPSTLADPHHGPFHVLIRTIIDQQLHVKVARRMAERLLAAQGGEYFCPDGILGLGDTDWKDSGLSASKRCAIETLAHAKRDGTLDMDTLARRDDEHVARTLTAYRGVGPWTADIFLMFALGREDILPLGDLALRAALRKVCHLPDDAPVSDYLAAAEIWRPYRSLASWYLWTVVD